jgi:hypothetical protein
VASFFKFNQFIEDLGLGVHNLETGALKIYLTDAAPSATLDAVKADLAEITNQNGYTAPMDVSATYSETSGTGNLAGSDVTVTATGAVGPFRYAVLFNDTPSTPADPLIGAWDYASEVTLANGETFLVDFGSTIATFGP